MVNIAEKLLKVCMDNPKLCNSTDLNEDRFLTDIGVSYLMAAEIAEKQNKPKEDIITYLNNGQSALEKVKKLDLKIVKQNLQIISYMLKKYQ